MAARGLSILGLVVLAAACREPQEDPLFPHLQQATGDAAAYGIWTPGAQDTCAKAVHDGYAVVGPDGLRYPTWHPPVDPITGCTFGHEHGRDPSGSDLFALVGKIPFGYANQHLEESGFGAVRNEDHVGHKIEWENDVPMRVGEGGDAVFAVTCDVLVKMHQGTHSPDAFTNNLHEIAYHLRCTDGTGFDVTVLTPIGEAGELTATCSGRGIPVGTPTPPNSPDGGGARVIPEIECLRARVLRAGAGGSPSDFDALRESWQVHASLRRDDGRTLVSFDPYFQVLDPSRYFDPAADKKLGRSVDLCFGTDLRARGGPCREVEGLGPIAWDDPRSPFKGVRRFVDINGNRVDNAQGGELWYTDPLGRRASPLPFPGSIVQWVARHQNRAYDLHGPTIGNRSYNAKGVHAPG